MEKKIEALLAKIRPALNFDGGDIEFVRFNARTGQVQIRFVGMCSHCAISEVTLKHLVEKELKKKFSKITEVIPV